MSSGPSDPSGEAAWGPTRHWTPRRIAVPLFGLLAVEFVLGISPNLFVTLPSGSGVVATLTSSPILALHLLVAVLLIGISARAVSVSYKEPNRGPLYASLLALVSAIVATVDGSLFVFDGQSAGASFGMAMGFLGVLIGAFLLWGTGPGTPSLRRDPVARGSA